MDNYLARQPVFTTNLKIFGYELLFRDGFENSFPGIDQDAATLNVLSNAFVSFKIEDLLGKRPGLINFTESLLLKRAPLLFPPEHVMVEVLEDIDPSEEIVAVLKEIRAKGFKIALDDFVYHQRFEPMMDLCHIIKFDLLATPLETLGSIVEDLKKRKGILLLAEKVETHEAFRAAEEMGFSLFQGYFFSKPEVLKSKDVTATQIARLRLIKECSQENLNIQQVESLIKKDVAISYKLLKFINSAYFSRPYPLDTIKDAIVFLGVDELVKFVNVVVVSVLNDSKPNELLRLSLIRARMCELCGQVFKVAFSAEELFMLGLFSLMDAILDCEMTDVLSRLDFSERMETALTGENREFNKILDTVRIFEGGNWDSRFFNVMSGTRIEKMLPSYYLDAVKMADAFFE